MRTEKEIFWVNEEKKFPERGDKKYTKRFAFFPLRFVVDIRNPAHQYIGKRIVKIWWEWYTMESEWIPKTNKVLRSDYEKGGIWTIPKLVIK